MKGLKSFLLRILCLFIFILISDYLIPKEFQPDEYTLFLAHFENLEKADYSLGSSYFAGTGAILTEGYYGKGIYPCSYDLDKNFLINSRSYTPYFTDWGLHLRGNVNPYQGTFELWFKFLDSKSSRLSINAYLARSVKHPQNPKLYTNFYISIGQGRIDYTLPTLKGECFIDNISFSKIPNFNRSLGLNEWHHFALTWSQGEMVMFLDGRILKTFDMRGHLGLVLMDNPVRFLSITGCVIDELRISNIVRYLNNFEPEWRDGRRPSYAFTGNPETIRYPFISHPIFIPKKIDKSDGIQRLKAKLGDFELTFSENNGYLVDLVIDNKKCVSSSNGLLIYKGIERKFLQPVSFKNYKAERENVKFEQFFEDNIYTLHEINLNSEKLIWNVKIENKGKNEIWIEPLLSIPLPLDIKIDEIFDGCEPRANIKIPRHRDEYFLTLPFTSGSGDGYFVGVGIDPHIDINDIVTEWIPEGETGILRVGTKIALFSGETFLLKFYIVKGNSNFGVLDAIEIYHSCFPDLYKLRPDVPVYSYMPATQDFHWYKYYDFQRMGYAGCFWGHGPGHDKGDEYGTPEFWNNPKYYEDTHYKTYTRRIEEMWGSLEILHKLIPLYYKHPYDFYYSVRRFHTCPDLTPKYLFQELYPGYLPNDDPLCFGHYYSVMDFSAWVVNEYNTPVGEHFRDQTRKYFDLIKQWCPGYINDFSHAGSLFRHNDPIAQKSSGRSFSFDFGTFVRSAPGRKQRYEILNNWITNGYRGSFWSDGGLFSYIIGAYSSAIAIEGADIYKDLTGSFEGSLYSARFLIGEKPFTAITKYNDFNIGRYVKPEILTPSTLRDLLRYLDERLSLYCIKYGITLDPTSYYWGKQIMWERAPVIVESLVLGRKIIPASIVREGLWVIRAGDGLKTFFVIGNDLNEKQKTDIKIFNRYFNAMPILVSYYGGETKHSMLRDITTIPDIEIGPRDFSAFKVVGLLKTKTSADVISKFSGDGITLNLELEINATEKTTLQISDFGPLYKILSLNIDGQESQIKNEIEISKSPVKIKVLYHANSFDFNSNDWNEVELIKDREINFCIVANKGKEVKIDSRVFQIGFERGTAEMLVQFIEQYDEEDGKLGNLKKPEIVDKKPTNYNGWVVLLIEDKKSYPGVIKIDKGKKEIKIEGATQGEIRRAMVLFLRLLDRKYPHIGKLLPLRGVGYTYEYGNPLPFDKIDLRKETREFFEKFSDPLFLIKPVLRPEYENIYKNDNIDFAGKYILKFSPYIFEPTYGDNFVYGYTGAKD